MARNVNVQKGKQGFQPTTKGAEAPTSAPSVQPSGSTPSAGDEPVAGRQVTSAYTKFQDLAPPVRRLGSAMPGFEYTSMYIQYRNPKTGHVRTEWAGELHGSWEGDTDPASEMISQLRSGTDGYLPYRAVLTARDEHVPDLWNERDVVLLNGEIRHIADRLYYAQRDRD